MPGKKGRKEKDRKEEKKEPEKEPVLPDGPKTHVVGSWSSVMSLNEAVARVAPGDRVLIYPFDKKGTPYDEQMVLNRDIFVTGSGVGDDPVTITAARGESLGASVGVELSGCTVAAVVDQEGVTLAHAAGVGKGWFVTGVDGVEVCGDPAKLAALFAKGRGTVTVEFRQSVTGDSRPVIGGGLVSSAASATITDLVVRGGVAVKEGKLSATGCVFSHASNVLTLWPYSKPEVRRCRFASATKACVYCFPHSMGIVERCDFVGGAQQGTCALFLDNGNTKFVSNTIRGHSTGVYVTCDADADKGRVEKPLLQENDIADVSGTGVHIDKCADAHCKRNTISRCGYWGITVSGNARGTFSKNVVDGKVRVLQGSHPQFVANRISDRLIDYNDQGTTALDERY
eukprot:TRINITY_DN5000_c0_g1_i1.p1 TRINITY_DN5000_c0_g1~~TRINITY_DN5000_c0_g1_i1.p1  ORF type:complete len:399 (+),score=91.94 TRINITY_DN5000_c0_g1_i1:116-1312(+)